MTWSDVYLVCFLVGVGLSVLSLLAGSVHMHLPHLHLHTGIDVPHAHAGAGGHGAGIPLFNFSTIAAFLAWFGGTGYLLRHYYGVWYLTVLGVATVSGIGGAAIVFLFLAKVLMRRETQLDAADYDMTGVLGKRRVAGARSEDGVPIPKGLEVMVTRYEKGIAYVRPWEDPMESQWKN